MSIAMETRAGTFHAFAEIESLVRAFERGDIARESWDHQSHVTVACWYLLCSPYEEAVEKMRAGLLHYLDVRRIETTLESGYHETITVSWMRLVDSYLKSTNLDCSLVELINDLIEHFRDKDYLLGYFTRERLMSGEARYGWLDPDLKQLP
jgi:hypothetical protein